jgi:hypothetical protein
MRLPLPIDARLTGGATTAETVASLGQLASAARAALRALCGGVLNVPEFEAKVAFGLHIEVIADLLASLETRRAELAPDQCAPTPCPDNERAALILTRSSPVEIVAGIYQGLITPIARDLEALLMRSNPLFDRPTAHTLSTFVRDLAAILRWGEEARVAYVQADADPDAAAREVTHWLQMLESFHGPAPAAARPRKAARDPRFATFAHTRDYRRAEGVAFSGDPYADMRLELAWINRDEQDAIETFALVLFDLLDTVPLDVVKVLGRFCADEARHTLIGHLMLEANGIPSADLPVSTIGIDLRARMEGWEALAQISLFGELGIIGPMRRLARQARSRNDAVTAMAFEFICADERFHLRNALYWFKNVHPARDLAVLEASTRRTAGRLLAERGLIEEAAYEELDKREISKLLGE